MEGEWQPAGNYVPGWGFIDESPRPSLNRLMYLATCLTGHPVEVQCKNGSVYSGIFHATKADRDFGIVLKSARLIKDVPPEGKKAASDSTSSSLSRTLIIPAHVILGVVAKDVPITGDGKSKEPVDLEREPEELVAMEDE